MRISIQVMKTPSFQDISSALRIAEAAINKGHEVSLILLHDAVHAIEKSPEEIQKNLKELMSNGVRVYAYGPLLESEGVSKDILSGVVPIDPTMLPSLISESDREISVLLSFFRERVRCLQKEVH